MGAQEQTSKDTDKQHKNENALGWWQQNYWFNSKDFERETAAARAINVLIGLEIYDTKYKNTVKI